MAYGLMLPSRCSGGGAGVGYQKGVSVFAISIDVRH